MGCGTHHQVGRGRQQPDIRRWQILLEIDHPTRQGHTIEETVAARIGLGTLEGHRADIRRMQQRLHQRALWRGHEEGRIQPTLLQALCGRFAAKKSQPAIHGSDAVVAQQAQRQRPGAGACRTDRYPQSLQGTQLTDRQVAPDEQPQRFVIETAERIQGTVIARLIRDAALDQCGIHAPLAQQADILHRSRGIEHLEPDASFASSLA